MAQPLTALTPSMSQEDSLAVINNDFNSLVGFVDDFKIATAFVTSDTTVMAGQLQTDVWPIVSVATSDTIGALLPRVQFVIDTVDNEHIYPDGTGLTTGQRKFVMSTYIVPLFPGDENLTIPIDGGGVLHYIAYLVTQYRNADSVDHAYHLFIEVDVVPKPEISQFR